MQLSDILRHCSWESPGAHDDEVRAHSEPPGFMAHTGPGLRDPQGSAWCAVALYQAPGKVRNIFPKHTKKERC